VRLMLAWFNTPLAKKVAQLAITRGDTPAGDG
jgi:hypothetical protein